MRSDGKHKQPRASVKNHCPASIDNASQVPQVCSPGTIIQPLFSPGSFAQLLFSIIPKLFEKYQIQLLSALLTKKTHARRYFGTQSRLRCHKPQLSLLTWCSRTWEALDHLRSFSWRGADPKAPGVCFVMNQSSTPLAHRDPALRNLTAYLWHWRCQAPLRWQTEENAAQTQCLQCRSCCWSPFPWDLILVPPFSAVRGKPLPQLPATL